MIHTIAFFIKFVFTVIYTLLALNILNVFLIQWGGVKPRGTYAQLLKKVTEPILKPFTSIAKQFPGTFFIIENRIVIAYIFFAVMDFICMQIINLFIF